MPNRLQVVSSWLLNALVCVYWSVPGRARQIFAIDVGYVLAFRISIALCKTEIYYVDWILSAFGAPDQEIIRLYISVDYALLMNLLYAFDHLNRD